MNEKSLDRYAQILVQHALGLRPGQRLDVWGELIHRDFALRIGEAAYSAGAGQVRYRFVDPLEAAQLIRRASPEQITLHYLENRSWLNDVLRTRGALLVLVGKGDPQILAELQREHPRSHAFFGAESNAVSLELTRRVVDQQICPASTAICPTPAWARAVFPELSETDAHQRFWSLLCEWTGADRDDATAHGEASARVLLERTHTLDALEIRELHLQGGGCDLRVGLSAASRWQSGALSTRSGQRFFVNFPTFEIFTTPDRRLSEGRVAASKPLRLPGGAIVEDLVLELRGGRVVDFTAANGADVFAHWLEIDDGARYLGEIALVDSNSPIARSGRSFQHPLLDENASPHLALGLGFAHALEGGQKMIPRELEALGCNRSAIHLDIPFGSPETDVVATRSDRGEVTLLEHGRWAV